MYLFFFNLKKPDVIVTVPVRGRASSQPGPASAKVIDGPPVTLKLAFMKYRRSLRDIRRLSSLLSLAHSHAWRTAREPPHFLYKHNLLAERNSGVPRDLVP